MKIVWISIKIALIFFPESPINIIPSLVQIMAWRRSGDKQLSEPVMVNLKTHASLGLNELNLESAIGDVFSLCFSRQLIGIFVAMLA